MCIYNITTYSCGHTFPSSLMENGLPACTKCEPIFIAMHYYHDQKLYQSFEGQYMQPGRVLASPRACPCIKANQWSTTNEARQWEQECNDKLYSRMASLGIDAIECARVRHLSTQPSTDSTRQLDRQSALRPYPIHMLQFIKDLEKWQLTSPQKAVNVRESWVGYGCGRGTSPACLEGWTGQDILMFRHGEWNHGEATGEFLVVDYGNVTIHQPVSGVNAAHTRIGVPLFEGLKWVLASVGGSTMVNTGGNATAVAGVADATGFVPGHGAAMNL